MNEPSTDTNAEGTRHTFRSSTNRVVGGVAGGIGERFAIDANLVRVGFIVVTFLWGIGALIYIALWVLVPRRDNANANAPVDDATLEADTLESPRENLSPRASSRRPAVVLVLAILCLGAVLVALRHGLPQLGGGLAGLWLLALAFLAVLALRKPGPRRIRRALAIVMVAILSVMIVITGAVAAFLATAGVPLHGGIGTRTWQPLSLAQTRHDYALTFGRALVDLSAVRFPTGGYVVNASVGAGELDVIVPSGAVVDLRTHVGAGASSYPQASGFDSGRFIAVPASVTSAASRASAAHLTLTVQVGIGHLLVRRAG